jgi:hypothetical protein
VAGESRPSDGTPSPTDSELTLLAVRLVRALMRSASAEVIDPRQWWTRAKSALETAASSAESWPDLVTRAGQRLQIDVFAEDTCNSLCSIEQEIGSEFARFRELAARDALYVVAMAQAERARERAEWEASR